MRSMFSTLPTNAASASLARRVRAALVVSPSTMYVLLAHSAFDDS